MINNLCTLVKHQVAMYSIVVWAYKCSLLLCYCMQILITLITCDSNCKVVNTILYSYGKCSTYLCIHTYIYIYIYTYIHTVINTTFCLEFSSFPQALLLHNCMKNSKSVYDYLCRLSFHYWKVLKWRRLRTDDHNLYVCFMVGFLRIEEWVFQRNIYFSSHVSFPAEH